MAGNPLTPPLPPPPSALFSCGESPRPSPQQLAPPLQTLAFPQHQCQIRTSALTPAAPPGGSPWPPGGSSPPSSGPPPAAPRRLPGPPSPDRGPRRRAPSPVRPLWATFCHEHLSMPLPPPPPRPRRRRLGRPRPPLAGRSRMNSPGLVRSGRSARSSVPLWMYGMTKGGCRRS